MGEGAGVVAVRPSCFQISFPRSFADRYAKCIYPTGSYCRVSWPERCRQAQYFRTCESLRKCGDAEWKSFITDGSTKETLAWTPTRLWRTSSRRIEKEHSYKSSIEEVEEELRRLKDHLANVETLRDKLLMDVKVHAMALLADADFKITTLPLVRRWHVNAASAHAIEEETAKGILTADERAQAMKMFVWMDTDQNGNVDFGELSHSLSGVMQAGTGANARHAGR